MNTAEAVLTSDEKAKEIKQLEKRIWIYKEKRKLYERLIMANPKGCKTANRKAMIIGIDQNVSIHTERLIEVYTTF